MTHTPTPWIFKPGYDNTDGDLTLGSIMGDDTHIARIWNDQEYAENDAQFIVTACNAHEELVRALQKMEKVLRRVQDTLATYIIPDSGIDDAECINELLGIVDNKATLTDQRNVLQLLNTIEKGA